MGDAHSQHHPNYFMIFVALCLLTAISVACDLITFEKKIFLIFAVLGVATAKALFVMTYFMHLKFEGRWKYVLLAPTIILAMGLPMALLPDIGLHYYMDDVPQTRDTASHADHAEPAQPTSGHDH